MKAGDLVRWAELHAFKWVWFNGIIVGYKRWRAVEAPIVVWSILKETGELVEIREDEETLKRVHDAN
jgi:hypothetical protein